jgi:hypothetical protein
MFIRLLLVIFISLSLSSCGTFTPIPSHGGGKRFAMEQVLVSASIRKVISEIPIDQLRNKKVLFETTIVHDEGGGAMSGGRPYMTEVLNLQKQQTITSTNGDTTISSQRALGAFANRSDTLYTKDVSFNNSDGKQFTNLLASALVRQNVMLNPNGDSEGEADYFLEVIVDVLGTWRSRTDWVFSNSEQLKAISSIEYVITPMKDKDEKRIVGRIGYEAEYTEKFLGWMGPISTEIILRQTNVAEIIPTFGEGNNTFTNLKRVKPVEYVQPDTAQPIQVNPKMK